MSEKIWNNIYSINSAGINTKSPCREKIVKTLCRWSQDHHSLRKVRRQFFGDFSVLIMIKNMDLA